VNVWVCCFVFLVVSAACFVAIGVSTVYGVTVAATVVAGFVVSGANLTAYRLLFSYCNHSASGTIGWCETGGNLMSFSLPLIFGAIVDSQPQSLKSSTLRLGMAVPASFLAASLVLLLILFLWHRRTFPVEVKAIVEK
jgi:nitrate/nitrite transporter NarK